MKVREVIELLLRQNLDSDLVIGVRLDKPSLGDEYESFKNDKLFVPVGDVRTANGDGRPRTVLECPVSLILKTEVELNDALS